MPRYVGVIARQVLKTAESSIQISVKISREFLRYSNIRMNYMGASKPDNKPKTSGAGKAAMFAM